MGSLSAAVDVRCQWEVDRSPFEKAVFGKNQMTARTDGCLRANNGEVFAIAEVKPNARNRAKRPELLWQETGEMITWFMHDISVERNRLQPRRLLVSQDNHAIYLTLASVNGPYIEYLQTGLVPTEPLRAEDSRPIPPFLKMQQYGPWKIL
ncbi:hypothetical protein N7456_006494 [Penicillium angulare]|uniref:Uncharacterized protein n=1 Tax=Penicillium angulare TaxID=116970 RepID=A0A9W9KCX9_9EURO|nr:hypothetical protein N7456_006494 [Penicillium angulare]